MINKNTERFLKNHNIKISPRCLRAEKEECYTNRKYGSPLYTFYDCSGIKHFKYNNKDYRRKILTLVIYEDFESELFPSKRRIANLKNIIRTYTTKPRILSEHTRENIIKYEILFTANNTIKSFQYWMDELAFQISDNSTIHLMELSLDICYNKRYKKIVPQNGYVPNENKEIVPINNHLDKLNDFELATIGTEYEKELTLPPYELAVNLEFDDEFFKENHDYYHDESEEFAEHFFQNILNGTVIK